MANIKLLQIGLGPIGQRVVQYCLKRNNIDVVAAVDPAKDKAGCDLGKLCGVDELGIQVAEDLETVMKTVKPDVAVLTTVSSFEKCADQAEEIVRYGICVVSTCEEMAYPWKSHPQKAAWLDEQAKKHDVAVLGTGVNPGFFMDYLPVVMTGVCKDIESIKIWRIQDASQRRVPFQQKIGAGLTCDEFEEKKKIGTLRHVGLVESIYMIGSALGWKIDKAEDLLSPIIAEEPITSGYKKIEKGMACGVEQIGRGYVNGKEVITLVFRASVGQEEPEDRIEINGNPKIISRIAGGVNGDIATCAITVNAVNSILNASPGLRIMTEMPVISCFDSMDKSPSPRIFPN